MRFTTAFSVLLAFSACNSSSPGRSDDPRTENLDHYMQHLEKEGFSGAVICVHAGIEVLKKGYGFANRETSTPNTTETVFTIGSISKQFTAAAILKLEMMGKLSVEDSLGKFFPDAPADKVGITLHQLLTMSAGFVPALGDDYETLTRNDFVRRAMDSELLFAPGERFEYSNVSYSILGAVAEQVSGTDYESFCNENLWLPAGMSSTGYVIPNWKSLTISTGYGKQNENTGTSLDKNWDNTGPFWNLKCNGGVLSTCEDMFKWYLALAKEGILGPGAKNKMYTPWMDEGNGGAKYGYGWSMQKTARGTGVISHNGGNGIFFADYLNFENENAFVFIQSNASKRGMQDVAWELGRTLLIPGYVPELKSFDLKKITLSEADKMFGGGVVAVFLDLQSGRYPDTVEMFITTHLGPGLLESYPMSEHLAMFDSILSDLKGLEMKEIRGLDGRIEIDFSRDDKSLISLFMEMNESGKIQGLGINN